MKNRRGEIATILTIGTLVVIGIAAVVSSLGLNKKTSTSTRASTVSCTYSSETDRVAACKKNSTCDPLKCQECTISGSIGGYYCYPKTVVVPTCIPLNGTYTSGTCCEGSTPAYDTGIVKCVKKAPTSAPVNTLAPSAPPTNTCKTGSLFTGTAGYNQETCSSVCVANNGVYAGSNQQWNVGGQRQCCCTVSDKNSDCPVAGLSFGCCVQDNYCTGGENRYRWYGCTGQACENTKINNTLGHLISCPYGVGKSNPESCQSALPPTPMPTADPNAISPEPSVTTPPDSGAGCTLVTNGSCAGGAVVGTWSYYKSKSANCSQTGFSPNNCYGTSATSCETSGWTAFQQGVCGGNIPLINDCEQKQANCAAGNPKYQGVDKFTYYKSKSCIGTQCYSVSDATNCTQSAFNDIANFYCKGTPLPNVTQQPPGGGSPAVPASTTPTYNPTNANFTKLGSIDVTVNLLNMGGRTAESELMYFNCQITNGGGVGLSPCAIVSASGSTIKYRADSIDRYIPNPGTAQYEPMHININVTYSGRATVNQKNVISTSTQFRADEFSKSFSGSIDFNTIKKNFSISVKNSGCISDLIIPQNSMELIGLGIKYPSSDVTIKKGQSKDITNSGVDTDKTLELKLSDGVCQGEFGSTVINESFSPNQQGNTYTFLIDIQN